ncbi:FAD-dependent oxidoreductase, partial [bacterium]|nr:FAD-dependent oxidoreductase [bacterium]
MKHIIIGAGPAGVFAGKRIRELDKNSEIIILSEENYPFYSRPRLPDLLAGKVSVKDLVVFKSEWYEEQKIDLRIKSKVIDIDSKNKFVVLENKDKIFYDKLLIAAGGRPFCPSFDFKDKQNVYTIRTVDDVINIKKKVEHKKSVVVIGGGTLGLEAAASFAGLGLDVTVVEHNSHLIPKQVDEEGGNLIKSLLEQKGVKVLLSSKVNVVDTNKIVLEDKRELKCDFVLISTG